MSVAVLSTLPTGDLWLIAGALVIAGVVTGLFSGMFGIGGGGVLVPVLFETFTLIGIDPAITMHLALGTSLAVIVPTSLRSFSGHYKRGSVDRPLLKQMAPWVVGGVVLGALIAKSASGESLRLIWTIVALFLAIKLAFGRDDWRLSDQLPSPIWVRSFAAVLGVLSTLMGIGGAIINVAFMTLFNRPLLQAVSTSSGLGPLIAIPGVIGFIWAGWNIADLPPGSLGYVSLIGAAVIVPASVLVAPLGVRLAHGLDKRWLEIAFATFLLIVAVRFIVGLVAG